MTTNITDVLRNATSSSVEPIATSTTSEDAAAMAAMARAFTTKMRLLQLFILTSYAIMCALCFALIAYLRYNRNVALKGDVTAARKIILPAFEPLIWILGITTLVSSLIVAATLALDTFRDSVPSTASEGFYCARMFVVTIVVIYMMQKSVTVPALVRTVAISFALSTYTLPIEIILTAYQTDSVSYKKMRHIVLTISRSVLLVLFAYVCIRPPGRASMRSLREYIIFVFGYFLLVVIYNQLLYQSQLDEGFLMVYIALLWVSLCPLFIWRVLVADTQHWRGMGQRAVALQSLFRQKHNINERISSQGLHVLIELHRKFIIDFAYLELKDKIGTGSSAVVFNGVLHSKMAVAVKVYTPSEFDENIVAEFSHEAALCAALHHPNIVKFYGMCVCPPTICLVSELCQGSLEDVTCAIARQAQHPHRQQQIINVTYMLDAARAVAYIHSFSPAFVHRDIKPSNFLVDCYSTVKLTDFGESRSLPKSRMETPQPHQSSLSNSMASIARSNLTKKTASLDSGATLRQQNGRQSSVVSDTPVKLTVKGTVDYMAPEIIQGRAGVATYGEAADVYSLAITMWDVLNPGKEKFPTIRNNHLHIFESVVDGKRPTIDDTVHPTLRQVIESAWHPDPRMRPSAQNIVDILETVQEEVLSVFASDLSDELESDLLLTPALGGRYPPNGSAGTNGHSKAFPAQQAIDRMEELCFVNNQTEAVRLGNALMDAGMLHHAKHERPFEPGDGFYYFDDDNINLCQPIMAATDYYDDEEVDQRNRLDDELDLDEDEQIDHLVPLPSSGTVGVRASSVRRHSSRRVTVVASSQSRRKLSSTASAAISAVRTQTSANKSDPTLYDGICSCRKLGQRLEQPKNGGGANRKRFRRMRNKGVTEDNLLTAKLLGADTINGQMSQGTTSDFDDFDAINTSFHKHGDDDVGGLA